MQHITNSLSPTFQLKQKGFNFWTKLGEKGHFHSKAEKGVITVNISVFGIKRGTKLQLNPFQSSVAFHVEINHFICVE